MLRRLYPDLRLITLLPDWHVWQERVPTGVQSVEGKPMWPLIEWVLAALWTGTIAAHRPEHAGPNRIVLRQGQTDVCALEAESTLGFFFLAAADAIAVAEFWHHINGLCCYLEACPRQNEFASIVQVGTSLRTLLAEIEVGQEGPATEEALPNPNSTPITSRQTFEEVSRSFDESLRDFVRLMNIDPGGEFGANRVALKSVFASDTHAYEAWLRAVNALTVGLCPELPSMHEGHDGSASNVFEYLRVRTAVAHGSASNDYACVAAIEESVGLTTSGDGARFCLAQVTIARWLSKAFGDVLSGLRGGRQTSSLVSPNLWHGLLNERLREQVTRLERLHHAARSAGGQRKLFRGASGHDLASRSDSFGALISSQNNGDVWQSVQQCALDLCVVVCESIEESLCEVAPPFDEPFKEQWRRKHVWKQLQPVRSDLKAGDYDHFKLVEKLRNRAAHGPTPERRKEWVNIQKSVSGVLGRRWSPPTGVRITSYDHPTDLVLTSYEGSGLKLLMIAAVNDWLEGIVESKLWVRG
jgi:hypothetical protein